MSETSQTASAEDAFAFGENWTRFLSAVDEERIGEAEKSLRAMLEVDDLNGKRLLDAGSGSGLFSLAARRLGAQVVSFDFDRQSVACTDEMKNRFRPGDDEWTSLQGSVLDPSFLGSLGEFDVVYSWGVLHHTGDMWRAMENVAPLVAPGGRLFIAIYNDQGGSSRRWKTVKKAYRRSPKPIRWLLVVAMGAFFELRSALIRAIRLQNPLPFNDWKMRKTRRGMSVWHDLVDWVGGYPFEVARPEEVFDFYRRKGFRMTKLKTCGGGQGCNEFVFEKA